MLSVVMKVHQQADWMVARMAAQWAVTRGTSLVVQTAVTTAGSMAVRKDT